MSTDPADRPTDQPSGRAPRLRRVLFVPLTAAALLTSGAGLGWAVAADEAARDDEPVVVVREPLAGTDAPRGVTGRSLQLHRVTVMPGARLASHHHPGTQVSRIENGTLTYSVETGAVRVMRGSADAPQLVRRVVAGETVRIRTGQWIVEQPHVVHHAANRGEVPVVIYLTTLFRTGAPAAIPD
ncbi:cupin domain-containing protein [Nocardioides ferulae]|uniref:cupin domain-containing protein n=1 Tax=Nocardioides ferulae TaxID=2340821 RepID=UPI000EAB590C|nr:cupin domain-containing protein [Nocardioides ferulae]